MSWAQKLEHLTKWSNFLVHPVYHHCRNANERAVLITAARCIGAVFAVVELSDG